MADRKPALFAALLVCSALFLPSGTQAQTEPLYRVELIVFSYPTGGGAEQWDATPDLAYPRSSRFLTTPEEPSASAQSPVNSNPPLVPSPAGTPALDAPAGPSRPTPFALLPSTQQELRDKAAQMERSGRYRLHFHESWLQPIADQANALPIVLDRSGDGGEWPALQGTIKLYAARELYIETNLWLNTQGAYLNSAWRMPPPPRGPATVPGDLPVQPEPESMAPTLSGDSLTAAPEQAQPQQPSTMVPVPAQDYPFRHAVLLHETRRVHYGKMTYIDHPMLGIIVKITPLGEAEGQAGPATATSGSG